MRKQAVAFVFSRELSCFQFLFEPAPIKWKPQPAAIKWGNLCSTGFDNHKGQRKAAGLTLFIFSTLWVKWQLRQKFYLDSEAFFLWWIPNCAGWMNECTQRCQGRHQNIRFKNHRYFFSLEDCCTWSKDCRLIPTKMNQHS